jgi:hypothetical protein
MQLIRGATLAQLLAEGRVDPRRACAWLTDAGAALEATHTGGSAHGAVSARNVFVDRDGRGLLSDFGLGQEAASVADDVAAFEALVEECGGRIPPRPLPSSTAEIASAAFPRRRRLAAGLALGVAFVGLAVTAAVLALTRSSSPQPAPTVLPGTIALGSALPASDLRSVDCTGRTPSGASEACTVVQIALPGRAVAPHRAGVIRRWVVRGAHGHLALEVIRPHGRKFVMVARTPYATVGDELAVLPADLPVRPGDLVGLEMTPGSAIGVRDTREATTTRWFGPLVYGVRPGDRGPGTGFDREVLLRVEFAPGAMWRPPGLLTGAAAAAAPGGQVTGRLVLIPGRRASVLVVARVGHRVVVDLLRGDQRLVRLALPDADVRGKLQAIEFVKARLGRTIARVSWQNPDALVVHEYLAGARELTPLS